jgi:hypothetical protein
MCLVGCRVGLSHGLLLLLHVWRCPLLMWWLRLRLRLRLRAVIYASPGILCGGK